MVEGLYMCAFSLDKLLTCSVILLLPNDLLVSVTSKSPEFPARPIYSFSLFHFISPAALPMLQLSLTIVTVTLIKASYRNIAFHVMGAFSMHKIHGEKFFNL